MLSGVLCDGDDVLGQSPIVWWGDRHRIVHLYTQEVGIKI